MARTSICLASRTEHETFLLQKKLEPLRYEVNNLKFLSSHVATIREVVDATTSVVVVNVSDWTIREFNQVRDIRPNRFSGGVVVLSRTPLPDELRTVPDFDNVVFVENPAQLSSLLGIVRKMLLFRSVSQQYFRRYTTNQTIEVELMTRRERFNSRLSNLSKGGARVDFTVAKTLKVGDFVRIHVKLLEMRKIHIVPAKVVWSNGSMDRPSTSAGLEFIGMSLVRPLETGF
jgi:hypothetical protein